MNRIVSFCLLALSPSMAMGQISFSEASLELPPTTIDSTVTAEFTVSNDLTIEQIVNFTGADAPFSISPNPLLVPSEGSASATVTFSPISVAMFEAELIASGNAFGTDTLQLSGEGTLPGAALILDTLDFGSVSVNSTATEYLPIVSNGIGSLFIDAITSDNPVITASGGVIIASGDTALIPVNFYSEFSGVYEVNLTIETSDPFNPILDAVCVISAISEVGGEVCGTWSAINSPYQLIDDIVVPDNCTLAIEPGVIVLGDNHDIEVFGSFFTNGTEASPVEITVGELLSHTPAEQMVLTHTEVTETNEFEFNDRDHRILRNANTMGHDSLPNFLDFVASLTPPLNEIFLLGSYSEDFNDGNAQGWTYGFSDYQSGSGSNFNFNFGTNGYYAGYDFRDLTNGETVIRRECCYSSDWFAMSITSPEIIYSEQEYPTRLKVDYRQPGYWGNTRILRFYIRFNGEEWTQIQYLTDPSSSYSTYIFDIPDNTGYSSVQFKAEIRMRYYGSFAIDNFVIESNLYPGQNIPLTNPAVPDDILLAASMSTGGIRLFQSTFNGDFHSVGDSIEVVLDMSENHSNAARDKESHGIALYADHVSLSTHQSAIDGHALDGVHIESQSITWDSDSSRFESNGTQGLDLNGDVTWTSSADTIASNGTEGVRVTGDLDWSSFISSVADNASNGVTAGGTVLAWLDSTQFAGNGGRSLEAFGDESEVTLYQTTMNGNGGGVYLHGSDGDLQADYSFITENGGHGALMGYNSALRMDNSLIAYNSGNGIVTDGAVDLNYMNVLHNGGAGIHTNQFSTVNNSIVWFNGGVPQMTTSNTYAASYTNVQGINALLTSTEFAWGDGCIGTDPVLADSLGHLDPFSPCVDGGMPWEQDAHIPYGLGSSRADMGMYGGPANAYWGGQAPPDGAVVITDLFDIPQDQGGVLGLHFTASPFDFGGLGFNVTHYSIWRDLALGSDAPTIVGDGNWEQIGTVPAQGFSQYGYTAATLVDAAPGDSTCLSSFIVIAHTTDDNIYWVSDVAAACSYDNLAPEAPELDGVVLLDETGGATVVVSWPAPEEDDYAYTVIERADGVSVNVVGDTLLLDADVMPGSTYDYLGYHLDMNGNPSDTAYVSVTVVSDRDEIALAPGWNLISLDRTPVDASVAAVMASLLPGNLQYVIGFDQGVTLYDPAGLPFLNSLLAVEDGYGYWVKVAVADTLTVEGSLLPSGYLPALDAGWNLIAYTPVPPAVPGQFFADLITEGSLEYVTGFNGGVQVYDPDGLPFLNSLTALQNGFGYWVKTALDGPGIEVVGERTANPAFDVLSGVADVAGGTVIEVMAGDQVVGLIDVLDGGLLMPTAVFGDDPSTDAVEGIAAGTEVQFVCDGRVASESLVWEGSMALPRLALTFGASSLQVSPNPSTGPLSISFDCADAGRYVVTLCDLTGRELDILTNQEFSHGTHVLKWDAQHLAPGQYLLRLHAANSMTIETSRVIIQ